MAEVFVEVAGRTYPLTCRDGEEAHLRRIAGLVDAKARDAQRAVGDGVSETRQMLLAALLLADEINDRRMAESVPPAPPPAADPQPDPGADLVPLIDILAERMELLAERLENSPKHA